MGGTSSISNSRSGQSLSLNREAKHWTGSGTIPGTNLPKKNTGEIPRRHAQVGSSGTRADPTVWCRRHSEWWSVGRGMGNYADGPLWAQRSAKGHGTWGMSWGPSAISGENVSCTAEAIVGGGVKDRIARVSTGMSKGIYREGPCQVSPLQQ